jgi:hypothetical protein
LWAVVGLACPAEAVLLRGDPGKDWEAERIAGLIKQLGDDEFAMREAAGKALEAIGEPALGALRKAAASRDDPEIRRRAEGIIQTLTARRETTELLKWRGTWRRSDGIQVAIEGYKWTWFVDGKAHASGNIKIVAIQEDKTKADFVHEMGPAKGCTAKAIVSRQGDALYLRGTDPLCGPAEYPAEFQKEDEFKRGRK